MSPDKEIKKRNGGRNNQQTPTDSDKESRNKLRNLLKARAKIWSYEGSFILFLLFLLLAIIGGILYYYFAQDGERVVVSEENEEVKQRGAGDTFRDCEACPEMVVMPVGSFMMGSPGGEEGRYGNEGPQHRLTISKPFAVGKYELTRGQFAAFIAATGYDAGSGRYSWHNPRRFEQSDAHPVINVSWDDAQAYLSWLSAQTDQQYRLLSEAEWEYAARAGTSTRYHFGDTINPSQANYDRDKDGTVAVGSYPANDFGLHDMHGNVREWVEDCWHDSYKGAPTDGSVWVADCDGDARVLRGGAWVDKPRFLRSALRFSFETGLRFNNLGFRVARTLKP